MSDLQDGDSPGRRPAGARPPPRKRSHGMFMRRHGARDSDDAPPPPLHANDPPYLQTGIGILASPAVIVPTADTPITPAAMVESPVTSPRLMATSLPTNSLGSPIPFALSPRPAMTASPLSITQDLPPSEHTSSPGRAFRALHLNTARARAASPGPPSPAAVQWSALRQAVKTGQLSRLASPAPSERSFAIRRIGSPAPSERSFALPRPKVSIPKPSRLARFGSRDLPQPVRGAEIQEARKFEADVRDACWASRYARSGHMRQKFSVDNANEAAGYFPTPSFSASSMHLPFVSASETASKVTLPLSGMETPTSLAGKRKAAALPQSPPAAAATTVHLQPLFDVISRYTQIVYQAPGLSWLARLPAENEVLSVLALPFLAADPSTAVEEQRLAVDCFDVMLRTWPATEFEDVLDRLLWSCGAASHAQGTLLTRLLSMVRTMTVPAGLPHQCTASVLRACFRALFGLQIAIAPTHDISRVLSNVSQGKLVAPDVDAFEEEFKAKCSEADVHALVPLVAAEVLVWMLDTEDHVQRQWCLSSLQQYWPQHSTEVSTMQESIYAHVSSSFCTVSANIIRQTSMQRPLLISTLASIFQARVLPYVRQRQWQMANLCSASASFFLTVLLPGGYEEQKPMWDLLEELWNSGEAGREALTGELRLHVMNGQLDDLVKLYTGFEESRRNWNDLMSRMIPFLFERLVISLPQPNASIEALLASLSEKYPQHFYKPLFACAGSMKDDIIAVQLATLTAVARCTPQFWVSNSEMIAVAILGDVGSGLGKGKSKEGSGLKWGRTRHGQCVVTLELVYELRRICGDIPGVRGEDRIRANVIRFAAELENRIAILIDAKEGAVLLPFSQRILLATVLLHLRRMTRSLKGATWLSRVSAWCCEAYAGAKATSTGPASGQISPTSEQLASLSTDVTPEVLEEVNATFKRIRDIYIASSSSAKSMKGNRPLSMASPLPSQADLSLGTTLTKLDQWDGVVSDKLANLKCISAKPAVSLLSLLVAVNGLLQQEDHALFGRVIWNRYLDQDDLAVLLPAAFLFMQYGERHPEETTTVIRNDLFSEDDELRQRALRRLSHLLSRRNQILAQFHITDRNHRRPFKGIRQPISFVATDIGSGQYAESAEEEDGLDMTAGVAREVKKRLLEIGWVEDENETGSETAAERLSLSLIPSLLLNRLGSATSGQAPAIAQSSSGQAADSRSPLLRRKSSAANYYVGVKRRIIFVSSVSASLRFLGAIAADGDPLVSGLAQELLSTSVRDDVALIGRPIMEMLSGHALGIHDAIQNLRLIFFAQSAIPPSFAHHILNHLVGFLKTISRDMERLDSYHLYATTMPLVFRTGGHVSDMALRDLRRNKVEALLLPAGFLWFPANAPAGPMFPRSPSAFTESIEGIPLDELKMLAIRTIQNMLVLQLLAREPKDIYTFEKTALPVLPSSSAPSASHKRTPSGSAYIPWSPWITLGMSYLLVARQLFKSLSSNLNDRAKLANMLEGINSTLQAFPSDLGIVSHSMIAYATACTRFRRLVDNTNGFTLFMPTIWNIYKSQNAHNSVRSALQCTIKFFYSVHGDAFVFQAIDCLATVLGGEASETASSGAMLYDLFKCLDRSSAKANDVAGIQDLFVMMAESAFATPVEKAYRPNAPPRSVSAENAASKLSLPLSTKRSNDDFPMENLIRLCLTIIAHDASSARAPRFLRVLRVLSRKLYQHSTSARDLLRDGIDALGVILSKNITARLGIVEANALHPDMEKPILPTPAETSQLLAFRREYLHLVKEYTAAGGVPTTISIRKTLALLRTILKDSSHVFAGEIADFLGDYAAACLNPGTLNQRDTTIVLKDFSQLFQVYGDTVDCSGLLNAVQSMVSAGAATSDPTFSDLVISELCRPALLICEAAASEHRLWDLPLRRATVGLISAVIADGSLDIFSLLDVRQPTPALLGGLVLPLVVNMPAGRDQGQSTRTIQPEVRCAQWLRILSYVLPACQLLKSAPIGHARRRLRKASPTRGEDANSRQPRDNTRQRLASAIFAFQALKVILLRASDDLQSAPNRIWGSIGAALRDLLDTGGADFLLPERDRSPSPSPSRPITPNESRSSFDNTFLRPINSQHTPQENAIDHSQLRPGPPRAVDFLLWTVLELIMSHATPLAPQMRVFVQERMQHTNRFVHARDHRTSRSPKRSSVFVRSRASGSPDPNGSPLPRQSLLKWSPTSTPSPSRLTIGGYFSVEAMTPSPLRPHGTRIVHLGPVASPAGPTQGAAALGSQVLRTGSLAVATQRSIQAVRICMGYAPLDLPSDGSIDDSPENFIPWTRASALARAIEESNALIELEFQDELLAHSAARSASLSKPLGSPVKEER
ncbi:hypothetical protein CALVIDRAFT_37847 [Calocera viscosa TUFC12733]|uniref:Protein UNC80 C-terminal domain-containing protein n=1 Tax=Calocera viscosa (strain TUFC12733) TaxID=1330018 RepID=A0A167NZ19_CALVF|nr:hypothetical protein CALVIDRAFT_37847 [Calocera viscosa TUFC12733]